MDQDAILAVHAECGRISEMNEDAFKAYIDYSPPSSTIILDGDFTIAQLEAVVTMMKKFN